MARLQCLLLCLLVSCVNGQGNVGPIFSAPLAVFQIREGLPEDSQVGTVSARDPDDDPVTYYIDPGSINSNNFYVNGTSGIIHTSRQLDREALAPNNNPLTLFVRATDDIDHGIPNPRLEVRIILEDVNDNAPMFSNLPNMVTFPENTAPGTTLFTAEATDIDFGFNSLVLYYIESVTPPNSLRLFSIHISTGVITLNGSLDFDVLGGRMHTISVRARDRGDPSESTVMDLIVVVSDVNDLPPEFTQPRYFVDIHENLTFGESVIQVEANDQDEGLNEPVTYLIVSGNDPLGGEPSFDINSTTGVIFVNVTSLDRERTAMYTLNVMAIEVNNAIHRDTALVDITVFDVNDNSPSFTQPFYNTTVPEDTATSMSILTVTAMDPDHGTHAEFSFTLENLLNASADLPFSISHNRLSGEGIISISDPLDFETTDRYVFRVIATEDINNQPRNGTTTVSIEVANVNDNSPVFENTTYLSIIPENAPPGAFVAMVRATDDDLGTFGELMYALMSGHMGQFNITENSGRVETTDQLDYETTPSYTISIRALDLAENALERNLGVTELLVMVENLNDNQPMFVQDGVMVEEVNVNVTEEQPAGTIVIVLEAMDADGDLTPLTFEIAAGNELNHFELNAQAQPRLITTTPLDHDLATSGRQEYRLTVTVNDTVNEDFLILYIQVVDINDNDPTFDNATYSFSICENLEAGSPVGVVSATDSDSGTFGELVYSLSGPGNENFYINSSTGEIQTAVTLNRELVEQYNLAVTAVDNDATLSQRRSSTVQVSVTVVDKNDNPPVFDESTYLFSVEENTEVVRSLAVRAQDADAGANGEVQYEIVSGNELGTFIINETSGEINRNPTEQIDRERMAQYNLDVVARDDGDPELNATVLVRIDILDQNDISPQFPETQYNATIPEDIPSGSIVTQVTAVDDDADENRLLRYTIISVSPDAPTMGIGGFEIDVNTGTVRTTGSFDREVFGGLYSIAILVQDSGVPRRNGSTRLIVYLTDINDNNPVFSPASYSQSLTEELPPNQFVVRLQATDGDEMSTLNSEVYFDITSVFATERVQPFEPPLPLLAHFYINATSGEVFTNVSLDYEAIRSYRIAVTARDRGDPQRASTTFVTVDVTDINDEPPRFSQSFYSLRVREDTSVNTRFTVVRASDADEGSNAELTYIADSMDPFMVDPMNGELVLVQSLDFETRTTYSLNITVMDGGDPTLYDTTLVNVSVQDTNDNTPIFNASSYTADVYEGNYTTTPRRIVTVGASDADSGELGRVTYEIFLGDAGGVFAIGNETGEVWVVGPLDKETVDQYTLTILAEDGGVPPATSTVELLVTVLDVNDNVPVFGRQLYTTSIQENLPPGDSIARVTATDRDEGNDGVVLFSITSNLITINEVTGVITTATSFNYEEQQQYNFTVIARDNGTSPQQSSATVTVNILDTNDLPPSFSPLPPGPSLLENTTTGTLVARVMATDGDSGSNGEVVYQLSNDEGNFAIDALGNITLVASLDREVTPLYNLTITALDRGQPQMSDTEYLMVTVVDVNDESPQFSQGSYGFLVPEDAGVDSVVAMVTVTDRDTDMRGMVDFVLEGGGGAFRVRPRRVDNRQTWGGEIIVAMTLDYETTTSYSLLMRARDQAPPFNENTANITITILDTNDNAPQFSMVGGYTLQVSERAPVNFPVGTVVATDIDGGVNGTVIYSFANGTSSTTTSTFSVDQLSGVITLLQTLDFETRQQYMFQVEARDNSSIPMSSSVTITVQVQDSNERAPVFDMMSYSGSVRENQPAGQTVLRVNATEPDTGLSAGITYNIVVGPTDRFSINPSSGVITTTAVLDREAVPRYILTVEARDSPTSSGTSLSTYVQVDITVEDTNDNTPDFGISLFVYNLTENAAAGTVLAPTLLATDRDEGTNGQVVYRISTGPFTVDANTGVIQVSDPALLDREAMPVFNLLLIAQDRSPFPRASNTSIRIVLSDVNDNPPIFEQLFYRTEITENMTSGVSVISVRATDEDENDAVTYAIQSGDDAAPKFTIHSVTGLIQTSSNPLDRETRDDYTLTVIATDSGTPQNTGSVMVQVRVLDRNDEAPVFVGTPLVFSVEEPSDRRLFIADLQTRDGDNGSNAEAMFFISSGNDGGAFTLMASTGELFANAADEGGPDFETQSVYNLRVTAVDQAPNPSDRLSSTTTVTVNITDINDNRPLFSESSYETAVVENTTTGETVLVVRATDSDSGSNGEITYEFQSPISVFSISGRTGVITVSGTLDTETVGRYNLVVQARDGGTPPRIGTANLIVRVVNINDNSPRFDRSFFVAQVAEDVPVNTTVSTLTASDLDSPPSSLRYSITSGDEGGYFKINSKTGLIQTARSLDREQVALFSLGITAEDDGTPPGNGTTTLQVTITDVNDERPQFVQDTYFAQVPENSPQGTQVLPEINGTTTRIEAVDPDQPNTQNSRVLYRLEGTNSDLFNIDFNTGIVTVARGASLDRETLPLFTFTVVATDSVPPPNTQSNQATLHITVEDVNDVAPRFSEPFGYAFLVEEDFAVGRLLTSSVTAVDPDSGAGGIVSYSITDATPRDAMMNFNISSRTGAIMLMQTLDRETTSLITLRVAAQDMGVPVLSSVVSVQITVSDVNDNPPEFAQSFYSTSVSESLPTGASAFQVTAEDPDVSFNAEVHYSIATADGPFTINPDTGVLTTTATLDHETQDSHTIIVEACDRGMPQMLCANTTISMTVADINDEAPQFQIPVYRVDIFDDTAVGVVLQPVATDQDSGSNAIIRYSLQGQTVSLFSINTSSGQISLDRPVTLADISTVTFTVVATDSGDPPLSGTADVIVRVLNSSQQQLRFRTSYIYGEIVENTRTFQSGSGVLVLNIAVGAGTPFSFAPNYTTNPFVLVPGNTVLELKSNEELMSLGIGDGVGLDREVQDLYTVIVRAHSASLQQDAYTSVTLRVLDANDSLPVFGSRVHRFIVSENQTAPVTVGTVPATDRDEGENAVILYSFDPSTNVDNSFEIKSGGVISTTRALDRETTPQYNLIILARNDGGPSNSATVTVEVLDVNDVTPRFTQEIYNAAIVENRPAGASVVMVTATDDDEGANGMVRYSLIGGDVGVFQLDPISGVITTLGMLDFEMQQTYRLLVQATDMGTPPLSSNVTVNIQVEDFNDCPPVFVNPPPSVSVRENATMGSVLFTFEIRDCDSGLNGPNGTRFSIIAGDVDDHFRIGAESGVLYTRGSLDRELQDSYLLSVQARDSAGGNSLSSVTQVTVVVLDVNDNTPVFPERQVNISVSEGEDITINPQLLTVTATDADDSLNGDIRYELIGDEGVFSIGVSTGVISLVTTLDRETTASYTLVVVARDRGAEPRSSNTTVLVTVEDENDNTPVIENIDSGVTTQEVVENTNPGIPIFTVNATDRDAGQSGMVVFSLEDASLPFAISSMGVITVAGSLDRETQTTYTLVIRAVDQGVVRLTGIATLNVRVLDANDNPPVFSESSYVGQQLENTAPGATVLTVTATDDDQGSNAAITYSLVGGATDQFRINPSTGAITNAVMLDRETQSHFFLVVMANNSLSHTFQSSVINVNISVLDDNDEVPTFDPSYYAMTISELEPLGTVILTVTASDNDQPDTSNSELIFRLSRQTNNPFHLDQNTGVLSVLNSLDHETQSTYVLTAVVEDKGVPPQSSMAIINITLSDENDEPPRFTLPVGQSTYIATVREGNLTFPYLVANLTYSDEDSMSRNRESDISIVTADSVTADDCSNVSLFYVTTNEVARTGQVFLTQALDHEQCDAHRIELQVVNMRAGRGESCGVAESCQLSGTATLEISVQDQNDNYPIFERTEYSGEVSTTAQAGSSVLTVRATDRDSGNFGLVSYRLVNTAEGRFRIDNATGTLFTRGSFAELDGVMYSIGVTAFDNRGVSPSLSSQAVIRLVILNDFQRVRILFNVGIDTIVAKEEHIINVLRNISGLTIFVESYSDYSNNLQTNFIFHAMDPATNQIVDFDEFFSRISEDELIAQLRDCQILSITPFAELERYVYPNALDTQTIIILVLCGLLVMGAVIAILLALRQRYVALHDNRNKLLADVFYASSMLDNIHHEGLQLEALELQGQSMHHQNPMFVHPYDNWTGVDTSGVESIGEASSLKRDNPLYESQEIRMEMFADVSDEEDGEVDDTELLAAALQEDEEEEEEEDASVTAI